MPTKTVVPTDAKTGALAKVSMIHGLIGDYRRARRVLRWNDLGKPASVEAEVLLARLTVALKALRDAGYVVRLDRDDCVTCAEREAEADISALNNKDGALEGKYAYVHSQDLSGTANGRPVSIHVGFGNPGGDHVVAGREVCRAIGSVAGLRWKWDGNPRYRVEVRLSRSAGKTR